MRKITQGDQGVMTLTINLSDDGSPTRMNLTGAEITVQVPAPGGEVVILPNSQVTILDQTQPTTEGQATVSFTSLQSQGFLVTGDDDPALEVLATIVQSGTQLTARGYQMRVYPPTPVLRAPGGGN